MRKGRSTAQYDCRGGAGEIFCSLSRFLGWERKLLSPLLVISLADRSQQRQETEKPGLSSPCLQRPTQRVLVGWAAEAAAPQIPSNLFLVPAGNRLVRQVGKRVLCSALGCPVQHPSLPSPSFKPRGSDKSVKCTWENQLYRHFGQRCHTPWCRMTYFFWQGLYIATSPSPLEILQPLLSVSRCCALEITVLQKRCWISMWNTDPCLYFIKKPLGKYSLRYSIWHKE